MDLKPVSSRKAWTVLLAAVGINLILGVLYAWGVIAKALVTQWQWSKTEAALPFTVATAAFAIMMIFAGRFQDKFGPRFVALGGGLCLGSALILSSRVQSPTAMLLTFGLLGGIGIGLGYSATTPPAIKWFPPSRKGFITGLVVSGVGLAAVYISPLTEYLLKSGGIPKTFLILGCGAAIIIALFSLVISNPPVGYAPAGPQASAKSQAAAHAMARQLEWPELLRNRQFYQLWVMFVLAASAGLMMIAHAGIIAKEQAGLQWGFMPIATLALFNTLGRIVSGILSDRIGRTRTMMLAFALQALNMFLFPLYTSPALLIFGSAFTGLCYGTIFTLMPATTADFYGIKNLGVNYGLLFTAFGVAGILGPILGGRIRDVYGSYTYSYVISAVLLLIGTALAAWTKPPVFTEDVPKAVLKQPEPVKAG